LEKVLERGEREPLGKEKASPTTWGEFVPMETVVQMYTVWEPLAQSLRDVCNRTVVAAGKQRTAAGGGGALPQCRAELAAKLEEIRNKTIGFNSQPLRAIAEKLRDITGDGGLAGSVESDL